MGKIVKVPKGGFKECPNCGVKGSLFEMGFLIEICNDCKALIYFYKYGKYEDKNFQAEIFEARRIN